MNQFCAGAWEHCTSPPSRGAWIEICCINHVIALHMSPPSRGAWIEMGYVKSVKNKLIVAPLAGGVD